MKTIVCLFLVVLIASPAFGALTAEDIQVMERIAAASDARLTTELLKINEELAAVKVELTAVKAELTAVKEEVQALQVEVSGVKGEVRGQETRITDLREQVSRQANTLTWVAGLLVTVLLAFVGWGFAKWLKDKEKSNEKVEALQEQLQAQQTELAAMQAELVRLRAENERLKPQSVTERGEAVQPGSVQGD